MVATTPLIAFWVIGDQSRQGGKNDLDYIYRISVAPTVVLITGVLSSLDFVAAARFLFANRPLSGDRRAAQLVALLMLAGVVLAFGARIVTAGVIGANIGGGFLVLVGLPMWTLAVAAAVIRYWWSGRSTATKLTGTSA
jgi:hypothetical protein